MVLTILSKNLDKFLSKPETSEQKYLYDMKLHVESFIKKWVIHTFLNILSVNFI